MSRIRVDIDALILVGFDPGERRCLVESLERELSAMLSDKKGRAEWARSHRTPVLRLGQLPLEHGAAGSARFGAAVARGIGKGLKP
jgi:hypothetical protein